MGSNRYTRKDLERDVAKYNRWLEEDGIPRRFSVHYRNDYLAIDLHHIKWGEDWNEHSNTCERNLDAAEPPRVLIEAVSRQYGHWYREFGEKDPKPVTRLTIRTTTMIGNRYFAISDDGRKAIYEDVGNTLDDYREGHQRAARKWCEKHLPEPEKATIKYGAHYSPYFYWPILIRGVDAY